MSSAQNNLSTPFIPPNERRLFVRVRKEVELNYRIMGAPMEEAPSPTRDVSAGGLRIATSEYLPFDTQVLLTASIRDTGVAFHLNGHVVWSVKHEDTGECEAGVAFIGAPVTVPSAVVHHDRGDKSLCYFRDPDGVILELAAYA